MEKYHGKETPRDAEYIAAYRRLHSQIKAAKECGVSRETVARACRRAGIQLDGRKYNRINGGGTPPKVTDRQLRADAETMSCREIAKRYGLSEEQVFRRARNLGIEINMKWDGGHWKRRATRYGCSDFDDSITLRVLFERDGGICRICGKPTDPADIKRGHIGRLYPTLDHIKPLSKGGGHTWDNVQLAHMGCNAGKCDKEAV